MLYTFKNLSEVSALPIQAESLWKRKPHSMIYGGRVV